MLLGMFWGIVLNFFFFLIFFSWFLLTECGSQLPGLRLSGKKCAGDKDLCADSPWPISNTERERDDKALYLNFNSC